MASPPSSARSPPGPSPLALPRQRPSLALPGAGAVKSRKPSIVSNTSSAHPLRQTSFPPDSLEAQHAAAEDRVLRYSPSQASQGSLEDEFSDSEIQSAISGPPIAGGDESAPRKRKRGDKKPRGRPPKHSRKSVSLVNGDEGRANSRRGGTAGAASIATGDNADDEDEDEGEITATGGRLPLYEGGQMSAEELRTDNEHRSMFRRYMDVLDHSPFDTPGRDGLTVGNMGDRMDVANRAKLRTADVRRLVNQTLSQSVPANVVTVVSSYTKMFAGLLIEEARQVQAEWMAIEPKRADGQPNLAYNWLQRSQQPDAETDIGLHNAASAKAVEQSNGIKQESSSSPTQPDTQVNEAPNKTQQPPSAGAEGLETAILECDRGPLQPDHLREALRRYKKARKGGTVGFTGLSLEGREVTASKVGGRRLFR